MLPRELGACSLLIVMYDLRVEHHEGMKQLSSAQV